MKTLNERYKQITGLDLLKSGVVVGTINNSLKTDTCDDIVGTVIIPLTSPFSEDNREGISDVTCYLNLFGQPTESILEYEGMRREEWTAALSVTDGLRQFYKQLNHLCSMMGTPPVLLGTNVEHWLQPLSTVMYNNVGKEMLSEAPVCVCLSGVEASLQSDPKKWGLRACPELSGRSGAATTVVKRNVLEVTGVNCLLHARYPVRRAAYIAETFRQLLSVNIPE